MSLAWHRLSGLISPKAVDVKEFVDLYIRYWIIPLWLLAGFADWMCHRRTHIERNAGARESVLHLAQMFEVGIPLLVALVFRINVTVMAIMVLGLILHEITALWDVSYARQRRELTAFEEHVHSFLELLPITAVTLVIGANFDQLRALPPEPAGDRFSLTLSTTSPGYLAGALSAAVLLAGIPYCEELVRCLRYRARQAPCRQPDRQ
ncbi:diguanylate cyclase [Pandoraea nosoerga]|uniref:Diguanylate cyclase n=1 Tax=Pandoraea nosoerga TaxID=2508296 RepID=A0A5E4UJ48_9BURK|nr:diguanylate cyclase [Pandoraea nosoerga]VVD98289.1 hypothetical protein PNO31109_01978 [Pandoraea nosoerga]